MDAVEQKILAAVDAQRETLLAFAQDIGAHAEPGFFETRTAARVAELLRGCGLSPQTGLARTGVKAVLQGGAPGPCAAVIGELDGIRRSLSQGIICTCVVSARSTPSKPPVRSSSDLPQQNSTPCFCSACRVPMGTYSSAGTAKNATLPESASATPGALSASAAPTSAVSCALCPQAWATPFSGCAAGGAGR